MTNLAYVPLEECQRLCASKAAPRDKAALVAAACRLNAWYAIKKAGSGHPGSTFSCMDLVVWLHLFEMKPEDIYFSSKGHDVPALYSVLTAMGQMDFELIHKLRRRGGLPGHPDVATRGMQANTGSLGMGISKAKGMALAKRLQGRSGRVFVLTGDGELQEGQIWESLSSAANMGLGEIVAIADCNRIQSDWWVEKVSSLGKLEDKARAFGWHVDTCDGHDFAAIEALFERLRAVKDKPKFVVARTVKGKGVSFMEGMDDKTRLYKYHSGAPSDEEYGKGVEEIKGRLPGVKVVSAPLEVKPAPAMANRQNFLKSYGVELVRQAEKNPKIVVLDADLVKDCALLQFEEKFPKRFIECGIAEQDMVSMAGGMARQGLLPIVHSFSCFLSSRPNEHIYNNALEQDKVIYVGSLAGLLPAGPGSSHQAVRDIASLASIPGLKVIEPCNDDELALTLDYAVNRNAESTYLRLVSVSCDLPYALPPGYQFEPGKGCILREGHDAVLFGYGLLLLGEACRAADLLKEQGIGLRVVNMPWLNCIDARWLLHEIGDRRHVFVLDNHYLAGGLGEQVGSVLAENGFHGKLKRLGVDRKPECGTYDEALAAHGLDVDGIARDVAAFVRDAG